MYHKHVHFMSIKYRQRKLIDRQENTKQLYIHVLSTNKFSFQLEGGLLILNCVR